MNLALIMLFLTNVLCISPYLCTANSTISDFPTCNLTCGSNFNVTCFTTETNQTYCSVAVRLKEVASFPKYHCHGKCNGRLWDNDHEKYRNKNCSCSDVAYTSKLYCFTRSGEKACTYSNPDFCNIPGELTPPESNPNPFGYNPYLKRFDMDVSSISFNIPQVIILTPQNYPSAIQVSWTYFSFNGWKVCNPGTCLIDLDYGIFQEAGTLFVKVFINDTLDNSQSFVITPKDACTTNCVFCFDVIIKWSCYSTAVQAIYVIALIALILAILLMIFCLLKYLPCLCARPAPVVFNNNPNHNDLEIELNDIKESQNSFARSIMEKLSKLESPKMRGSEMLVILLLIPVVIALPSCSTGVVLSSTASTCFISGSNEVCTFEQDVLATIPYIQGTSCIDLRSSETGTNMATLYITYQSSIKDVSLAHNYFISSWVGQQSSSKSCFNTWNCAGNPPQCSIYNGTPLDANIEGTISTLYPGRTICSSVPGCISNGCIDCTPGCVYSRYAFTPTGPIYEVFTPTNSKIQPQIFVQYIDQQKQLNFTLQIAGDITVIDENFQISIVGTLQGSTTEFGSRKVIVGNSNAYIGVASETNSPQVGIPGDIQANTIQSLTSPNPSSFIFDSQIVQSQPVSDRTTYSFRSPGISVVGSSQYLKLPATIGSVYYTYSNGQLIGNDIAPGAIVFSLQTRIPVTIQKTVNVVCPDISSLYVSGCYLCIQSASFVFTAKSICSSGAATVILITTNNITVNTPFVQLSTIDSTFTVGFSSSDKYIQGKLQLKSGLKISEFYFHSVLNDPVGVVIPNMTIPPGFLDTGSSGWDSFTNWFNGLGGAWEYVKWIVISIIIVVVVGGIIALSVFGWYKYKESKLGYELVSE